MSGVWLSGVPLACRSAFEFKSVTFDPSAHETHFLCVKVQWSFNLMSHCMVQCFVKRKQDVKRSSLVAWRKFAKGTHLQAPRTQTFTRNFSGDRLECCPQLHLCFQLEQDAMSQL